MAGATGGVDQRHRPEILFLETLLQGVLQDELADAENKIQAARRFYNGNTRDFNTKLQTFPTNLIAQKFGFNKKDFFEIDEKEKGVPEVKF